MTCVLNGNRFVCIVLLPDGTFRPRVSYCAGRKCRIYHFGQNKAKQEKNIKTAGKTAIMRAIAKTTNDSRCASTLAMIPVRKNASNTKKIVRISWLSTFVKMCFQISIPLMLTLTVKIINLQSTRSSWQRHCATMISMLLNVSEVMTSIVEAKLNQVEVFRDKVKKWAPKCVIVEATYDDFWGSGIDEHATLHTRPKAWPG